MQKSKIITLLVIAAALGGCATTEPVINTVIQRVEVEVPIPCKAEIPAIPEFNFDKLAVTSDIFEKAKSLLADRKLHEAYEGELLTALKSCVK